MIVVFAILPAFIGFMLVDGLWRARQPQRELTALKVCVGIGIGFGFCSLIYFIWTILGKPGGHTVLFTEVLILAVLIIWRFCCPRGVGQPMKSHPSRGSKQRIDVIIELAFSAIALITIARFIFLSLEAPHGYIDAWAIYNLKAKFLLEADPWWRNAFSQAVTSHADYPLLIPGSVARGWAYLGETTVLVPTLIAMSFTLITVGTLTCAVTILRDSRSQGCLAGVVLLGTLAFITIGSLQYADVPLACFCLMAIVCFALFDRSGGREHSFLVVAGFATAFATWTKNEGWLFLLSLVTGRFFALAIFGDLKSFLREMLMFSLGLTPIMVVVVYFKLYMVPPNDLIVNRDVQSTLTLLLDVSRYQEIAAWFLRRVLHLGGWPVPILVMLFYHLLCVGARVDDRQKLSVLTGGCALLVVLTGYFFVYVLTPHPLSWHLNTSLDRLLQHVWPSALFIYFLVVGTPEAVLRPPEHGSEKRGLRSLGSVALS